jgi:hypothetical protein
VGGVPHGAYTAGLVGGVPGFLLAVAIADYLSPAKKATTNKKGGVNELGKLR